MLRPIPKRILTDYCTLKTPEQTDRYGNSEYTETELSKVHIQEVHDFEITKENTSVKYTAILFYDAKISRPQGFDWQSVSSAMSAESKEIKLTHKNKEYSVINIDFLSDDRGNLHHIEVQLV